LLGLVAAVAMLTVSTLAAQLFDAGDLSGEELFGRYCAVCHGSEGRGDGPVAPTLRTLPPNLRLLSEQYDGRFPLAEIRQAIDGRAMAGAHGTREMPIWGYEFWVEEGADVTAEREAREIIDRLVAYLESIQDPGDSRFDVR
jgi:mono/diheme cytochrome c family protein